MMDNPRHTFVHGDILDAKVAGPLVEAADYVVHFAAETHVDRSIMAAGEFIKTDVEGSFILLEAARRNPHLHGSCRSRPTKSTAACPKAPAPRPTS